LVFAFAGRPNPRARVPFLFWDNRDPLLRGITSVMKRTKACLNGETNVVEPIFSVLEEKIRNRAQA
jgi:hypothetical protein